MACYHPVTAFRSQDGDISFSERRGYDTQLAFPCGACVGCRVARARSWSLRCVHEASLHKENCFVTLTYAPEHLPAGGSLHYRDFQLFIKRLRKHFKGRSIRYFVCGEYGEALSRPHYHACIFNLDFPDKRPVTLLGKPGSWSSKLLEQLWGLGQVHLGELNVRSAAYAARYCLKKVTGDLAQDHYRRIDSDGVVHDLVPEFARMSLRPGVGHGWFQRFRSDVFGRDYVVHDGKRFSVPKYYDRLLDRSDPSALLGYKEEREARALPYKHESSPGRLAVREIVEKARLSQLKREYES